MIIPPTTAYKNIRPIKRTIFRRPLGLSDLQALPPFGWCGHCGGEIYGPGRALCRRCEEADHG